MKQYSLFLSIQETFSETSARPENLTLEEQQRLCEGQSYHVVQIGLLICLWKFWISVKEECLFIHRKAANIKTEVFFYSLHMRTSFDLCKNHEQE